MTNTRFALNQLRFTGEVLEQSRPPLLVVSNRMTKPEIAKRLARQAGISQAAAADQLDRVVHQILSKLRSGESAPLPGLGRFTPGPPFHFEKEKRGAPGGK